MQTMMKHTSRLLGLLALLLTAGVALTACQDVTPGKDLRGGVYYQHIRGSQDVITAAARQVMDEMGYLAIEENMSSDQSELKYRTAFDTRITVTVKPVAADHSRVGVYITPGNSEGLSQNILKRIEQRVAGVR